jgi:hypothetical protein
MDTLEPGTSSLNSTTAAQQIDAMLAAGGRALAYLGEYPGRVDELVAAIARIDDLPRQFLWKGEFLPPIKEGGQHMWQQVEAFESDLSRCRDNCQAEGSLRPELPDSVIGRAFDLAEALMDMLDLLHAIPMVRRGKVIASDRMAPDHERRPLAPVEGMSPAETDAEVALRGLEEVLNHAFLELDPAIFGSRHRLRAAARA